MNNNTERRNLIVFLIYACLIAIIYAQVVFFGKSLLPSLFYPAGTAANPDYAGRSPVNNFNIDFGSSAFYEQPINRFIGNMYLKGQLPLWNPYQGCGVPLAAQYSTRAFYPYQIIENISPYWMWDYFILGRLLIAAFFTYLFLKLFGLSNYGSFLGGFFYAFSGSIVQFINNEQFMNVAMMLPVVMFCVEKLFRGRDNLSLVLCSLSIAVMLYAGQPEIAIYVLVLAAAYYFFRVLAERPGALRLINKGIRFIAALILGLGIAALVILPFLEYIPHSFNFHPLGGKMGVMSPASPELAICLILPYLAEFTTFYRFFPHNGIWDYLGGYSGISVLYLLILGFFYGRSQYFRYLIFFSLFGFLIILKNFGVPLVAWLGYLPLLDQSWSPRWSGPVWTFSFVCAGALGLETILQSSKNKRLLCWLAALFLLSLVIYSHYLIYHDSSKGYLSYFFSLRPESLRPSAAIIEPISLLKPLSGAMFNGLMVVCCVLFALPLLINRYKRERGLGLSIILVSILELWFYIPKGMASSWAIYKIIPFVLGLAAVFLFIKGKKIWFYLGVILTIVSSIYIDIKSPHGFPERLDPFFKSPYIEFLKNKNNYHRVVGEEGILMPNFSSAFGIQDIRYIDSLSPASYQNYVNCHLLKVPHLIPPYRLWFSGIPDEYTQIPRSIYEEFKDNPSFYSFLGVKYILASKERELSLPLVYDKEIKIYDNPFCLPRVFIAHKIEYIPSYIQAQRVIGSPGFDPMNQVVLEERAPLGYNEPVVAATREADIKEYYPNRVVIEAFSGNPGVLVLTDVFYPGWRAYVDNYPAKIYRINGLVRGVFVEKGRHKVVFKYSPDSLKLGLSIAAICMLLCAGLILKDRAAKKL